jgi:DNA invertase Pin-like site-specific DNA recombinase
MKKIGYARVSTEDQTLALQLDALRAAGCGAMHENPLSGVAADRPGLSAALAACQPGDVLHVWKLDRLGRSMTELVGIVDTLKAQGVGLKVLTGEGAAIDTTRPEGRLIFRVFAAFSEFEHELIRERTRAGMKAARKRGKHMGRPALLTPEKLDLARRLLADCLRGGILARQARTPPRSNRSGSAAGFGHTARDFRSSTSATSKRIRPPPCITNDSNDSICSQTGS